MKVWILAKKSNFSNYENKRFKQEAAKMEIDLQFVAPEDFEIFEPAFISNKILYKHRLVDPPDCIIPRTGSGSTYFALMVIRSFQDMGIFVLNNARSIENAKDKLRSIQILAKKSLPIPKTILAKQPLSLQFIKKELSFPLIFKTISGSEGKGVLLCENKAQLEDILELSDKSLKPNTNIILQEFISTSRGKDIRVFVVGGKAIGAMIRSAKPGKFKANYSAGGSVGDYKLCPEIEWLAIESAKALGLEIAGVDILFDNDGYRICEVNSAPYFKGFEKATNINIPKEIFRFLRIRLER